MKKSDVKVGGLYTAKVSDRLVSVRIDSVHSREGWNATNTATGKRIHIKSAKRLRGPAKANKKEAAAVVQAAQENACPRDERQRAPDGMTSSERAMEKSAKDTTAETPKAATTKDANTAKAAKSPAKKASATKPPAEKNTKPKRMGALEAAALVLKETGKPMRATELIVEMAERGLWESPAGSTPHATLYAAMLREARDKGPAARFKKIDRGLFAFNEEAK